MMATKENIAPYVYYCKKCKKTFRRLAGTLGVECFECGETATRVR